jgi:hypothetical protein
MERRLISRSMSKIVSRQQMDEDVPADRLLTRATLG